MASITASSSSDSMIAYHQFLDFLNDIKEYENTGGGTSLNSVYSEYADTPTRKRNRILQKKNETLEKLDQSFRQAVASSSTRWKDQCVALSNIKFVGLLVHFLCEDTTSWINGSVSQPQQREEKGSSLHERCDEMLQIFLNAIGQETLFETSSSSSSSTTTATTNTSWRDDLNLQLFCPHELTIMELCSLPSLIFDNLEHFRQQNGEYAKKRKKSDAMLSDTGYKHSLLQAYAILGYLITYFIVHDLKGVVVPLQSLQKYIQEQVVSCGLVEDRMYSLEYDAVMTGSIAYLLDCLDVSTIAMEEAEARNVNEYIKDKMCMVGDQWIMEDVQVGMIVDCLLRNRNSIFLTFQDVFDPQNRRAVASRIAKTLLGYTLYHVSDDRIASNDCMSILNFIAIASSPESAVRYLEKMNDLVASNEKENVIAVGNKRKNECLMLPLMDLSIDPIIVELQVLLCIPKLNSAISLVQTLDEQPFISNEDKAKGWFQLLDYLHQKDMLLNESRNAKFHSLTVGSNSGLDSILQFFQGIVHQVIDEVEKVAHERSGAMTDEEERWIRYHQLKVRKTLLKFCIGRAAFSSSNGMRALEVASQISGMKLEDNNYKLFPGTHNATWLRIHDILQTEIEVPEKPLYLKESALEPDDKLTDENHHVKHVHEENIQHKVQESLEHFPNRDDIIPPSPANVPFVTEPIYETDGEDDQNGKSLPPQDDNASPAVEPNDNAGFEISDKNRIGSTEGNKQDQEIILSDSEDSGVQNFDNERESVDIQATHYGGDVQENNPQLAKYVENDNAVTYENDSGGESIYSESYEESINADEEKEDEMGDCDSSDEEYEMRNMTDKPEETYLSVDDSEEQSHDDNQYNNNSSYSNENEEYTSDEGSVSVNSQLQRDTIEIDNSSDESNAHSMDDAYIQKGSDEYISSEGESLKDENSHFEESETEVIEEVSDDETNEYCDSNLRREAMVSSVHDSTISSNSLNDTQSSVDDNLTASESDNGRHKSVSSIENNDEKLGESSSDTFHSKQKSIDILAENVISNKTLSATKEAQKVNKETYHSLEQKPTDSYKSCEASIDEESGADDYSTASDPDNEVAQIGSPVEHLNQTSDDESTSKAAVDDISADIEPTKVNTTAVNGVDKDDEEAYDSLEEKSTDVHMRHETSDEDESGYSTASEPDNEVAQIDSSVEHLNETSGDKSTSKAAGDDISVEIEATAANDVDDEDEEAYESLEEKSTDIHMRHVTSVDDESGGDDYSTASEPDNEAAQIGSSVEYLNEARKDKDIMQNSRDQQETTYIYQETCKDKKTATKLRDEDYENMDEPTEDILMSKGSDEVAVTIGQDGTEDQVYSKSESIVSCEATRESPEDILIVQDSEEKRSINQNISRGGDSAAIATSVVDKPVEYLTENVTKSKNLEEMVTIGQQTGRDNDVVVTLPNKENQITDEPTEDIPTPEDLHQTVNLGKEVTYDKASSSGPSKVDETMDEPPKDTSTSKDLKEAVVIDECVHSTDQLRVVSNNDNARVGMASFTRDEEAVPSTKIESVDSFNPGEVSKMSYRALQKECKVWGLLAKGSAEELAKRILDAVEISKEQVLSQQKLTGDDNSNYSVDRCKDNDTGVNDNDKTQEKNIKAQDDYSTFSYKELQHECISRGLSGRGKKDELRRRLQEINTTTTSKDEGSCRDDDLSTVSYRDLQQMCKDRGINAKGKFEVLLNRLKKATPNYSTASPIIPKDIDCPIPDTAGAISVLSPGDYSGISMLSGTEKGTLNLVETKKKRAGRPPKPPVPTKKSKIETNKQAKIDTPRTRSGAKGNTSVASRSTRSSANRLTRIAK